MGRGLVPGLVLGVLLATAGCGSDDSEKEADEPSKAALDCREEWQDLKADVDGRVLAIHVDNGQVVEFGTLLFELEPVGGPPPAL